LAEPDSIEAVLRSKRDHESFDRFGVSRIRRGAKRLLLVPSFTSLSGATTGSHVGGNRLFQLLRSTLASLAVNNLRIVRSFKSSLETFKRELRSPNGSQVQVSATIEEWFVEDCEEWCLADDCFDIGTITTQETVSFESLILPTFIEIEAEMNRVYEAHLLDLPAAVLSERLAALQRLIRNLRDR
jgi:hypothetical protein